MLLLIPSLLFACVLPAQTQAEYQCHNARKGPVPGGPQHPSIADSRENDYDVTYVKLDVKADNRSNYLEGRAYTRAAVTAGSMNAYVFELVPAYTVDEVRVNGSIMPLTTSGPVRIVQLPAPLPAGASFEAEVHYRGQAAVGEGFFSAGIRTELAPAWNTQVTYTLSEPFAARDWWPCKQSLQDKIDSSDIWITVPDSLKAGSNGILERVTPLTGGFSRYEWKSRNRIDYYLLSFAAGVYTDYSYYMHFDGSSDSMLVQNYVYASRGALESYKAQIDSTALMVNYFSGLFGRYPFWEEKYGHCITPLGGGMEHQTMTTLNNFGSALVAHELGHQWFGDHVTCGTWSDIWLNEGFASYLAYLYNGYAHGDAAARTDMHSIHSNVLAEPAGSVYCYDTTDVSRIFSGRLSYSKGAAVIHTLRFVFRNDSLFFAMLRDYLQLYGGHTATTEQFKAHAAAYYGSDLDIFFDQWIYKEGYPVYTGSWNQVADRMIVRLVQTTSAPGSVALFRTPLELRFMAADGTDTLVRVENDLADQRYVFGWPGKVITGMEIDPQNNVLNRVDDLVRDYALLSPAGPDTTLFLVYPNPSGGNWQVAGIPPGCTLRLTDASGRLLWKGSAYRGSSVSINQPLIARGVYFLHLYKEGVTNRVLKLVRSR